MEAAMRGNDFQNNKLLNETGYDLRFKTLAINQLIQKGINKTNIKN